MRVLIAEDNNVSRLILKTVLQKGGHQIFEADNGFTAWEVFQSNEVDVIISDRMMPGIDGIELCKRVRSLPRTIYTYFIFLTSMDNKSQLLDGINAGADDYLTKPLDIEELKIRLHVAARITELHRKLAEQAEELKRLNQLKNEFVSIVSHEFRTPLSSILFSAQYLQRYETTASADKKLKHKVRIEDSVKSMIELLDEVLLVGKAEAGKLDFLPEPMDLSEYCRDLIEEFQERAGAKYSLQLELKHAVNYTDFSGDKKLLHHILGNLLSNAIKYTPQAGKVTLALYYQSDNVVLKVIDQGIGIPEADQMRMFESFHRAKNVGNISGTGLGLSIVKRCVDLHQGSITLESQVGVGTTFILTLPRIPASSPAVIAQG
jgi:signal transduction histidine kinase